MSFANKFNRGNKFNIDTKGFEYYTLKELGASDTVYPLRAVYINTKSSFGTAPVFSTDDMLINIPRHMMDVVNDILSDNDAIQAINDGKVGFTIYQYEDSTFHKKCFGVNFVDM